MAEKYSFFNAEQNSSGEYDRVYLAEDLAAYFASFVGTGIYASSTDNLKVYPSSGMTIAVKAGKGWIKGYYYENDSDLLLTLDNADGAQARVDSVVLRLDLTNRYMRVFVKKGVVAGNPVAPALTRTADVYELQLATIFVKAGLIDITEVEITDSRFNDEVCGIVKGIIEEIDTSNLFNQYDAEFNSWFETVKGQLSGDAAGNLQNQINDIVSGEIIPKSGISIYVHSKSGTVHNFEGTGENGKALITADFSAGDTFTVNGEAVSAYCGLEAPDESTIVNGRWVYFAFDGTQLNFKGGGGLSNKKLSSATALPENVLSGKTFYAGDKTIKTGTMPNRSDVSRPTKYQATDGAHLYSWIPYGYCSNYDSNGHLIEQPFGSVASAIGLTAAKIMKGNTILGIAGSGVSTPAQIGVKPFLAYSYDFYQVDKGEISIGSAPCNGTIRLWYLALSSGYGNMSIEYFKSGSTSKNTPNWTQGGRAYIDITTHKGEKIVVKFKKYGNNTQGFAFFVYYTSVS